tara:strand:+ start:155 stop:334 length:180 start_codon:yes stop_codon:yes gene_type:complete
LICFTGLTRFSGHHGIITAVWHIGMVHRGHAAIFFHWAICLIAMRIAGVGKSQGETKKK